MTEDEMVGWHHRLNGHEFEQALGVDDGQNGVSDDDRVGDRVGDGQDGVGDGMLQSMGLQRIGHD